MVSLAPWTPPARQTQNPVAPRGGGPPMRPGTHMTPIVRAPVAALEFSDDDEESGEEDEEEDSWMEGVHFDTGAPDPEAAPVPSRSESSSAVFCAPPPPAYVQPPPAATDDNLATCPARNRL
jgi:hypothetical protein